MSIDAVNVPVEFTYTYDGASNRLETETYPNGQTVEYGYGTVQQDFDLRRITNEVNGTLLSEFTYERDVAAGRITTWTQAASGEPTKTYTFGYDAANQLTSATLAVSGQPDEVTTYSYDAAGNRLTGLTDGVGASYSFNAANQLTGISGATPPEATYEWDGHDRLVQVTTGGTAVKLGYDGRSRLVSASTTRNGITEDKGYAWSGNAIVAETDGAGLLSRRFFDQGMILDSGPLSGAYYYARDHLRSIRELVDGTGMLNTRYSYSPTGVRIETASGLDSNFGFTGLRRDQETGLVFARFRIYDATLNRWLSRDPLGELAGVNVDLAGRIVSHPTPWRGSQSNRYAYVRNDPVNKTDRSGLADWDFCVRFTNYEQLACNRICDQQYKESQGMCSWFSSSDEYTHENCYIQCVTKATQFHIKCIEDREPEYFDDPDPNTDDGGKGAPCYDAACWAYR
jgi:RHS repeat-associated protein